ncbi:MAG: ADP-ribosylglycohydrolase family protein [Chloroherpetonaceae bacterium]|nr:ADP-ribosylglycohydrolase family protein [Chloroherpetonaceae bacterium]
MKNLSLTSEQSGAFLLGSLIGNALGLPAHGKPHHILRQFFKGIKGYTDEYFTTMVKTGLRKGQNSINPIPLLKSLTLPLSETEIARYLVELLRISPDNALKVANICFSYAQSEMKSEAKRVAEEVFGAEFINKMSRTEGYYPIDLITEYGNAMTENDAIELSITFFLRNNADYETFLLSTINMGGLTGFTGSIAGGIELMGKSIDNIPKEWIEGLESSEEIIKIIQLKYEK